MPSFEIVLLEKDFYFAILVSPFGQHSFLSKEGSRKAMLHMSDGGNPLRVIEIKDNGLYSVAAMDEHAILKNRVRVRVNYS